jgi:hypothetical protein
MNSASKQALEASKPSHTIFVWTLQNFLVFNDCHEWSWKLSIYCENVLKWEENSETT